MYPDWSASSKLDAPITIDVAPFAWSEVSLNVCATPNPPSDQVLSPRKKFDDDAVPVADNFSTALA